MGKIFEFPYRTVAEISHQALLRNLGTLRAHCRREIIPVLKADAYGHGMIPIAKVLLNRGSTQAVAVATLEEAIELRKQFSMPFGILVLSGYLPHQMDAYVQHNLIPVIYSSDHLKSLRRFKQLPEIHLKIDTGMGRLGLRREERADAIKVLKELKMKLSGLATHFAESEDTRAQSVEDQLIEFAGWQKILTEERLLNTDARIHVGNSGAILSKRLGDSNAVRPGLSLYGVTPNEFLNPVELLPILQWKTRIIAIKEINAGDTVGYGRTYEATKPEKIALLPVGYADGYPRLLSNRGFVLIAGKRVPVRGIVSMDLMAVDCTHVEEAREGHLVTLLGKDGGDQISAWDIARWADTIPYEIFCGLSSRVSRIYFDSEST